MATEKISIVRPLSNWRQILSLAILFSFVVFGPPTAEAGVLFQSSWNTATGTSNEAIFDGGTWSGGPNKTPLQNPYVSSGGPGGNNFLNMVTVGTGGWGGDGRTFEWNISGSDVFGDPDNLYIRYYFRVDDTYDVPMPNKHWFAGTDTPMRLETRHYMTFNKSASGEFPGFQSPFTIELANTGPGGGRFQAIKVMEKGRWYRYEIHVQKLDASKEKWTIRLDGVDITDQYHGMDGDVYGWQLDEWYAAGNAWTNEYHGSFWLTTYDMTTLNEGWDVACIEVRDDGWPGPVDGDGPPPTDTTPPTGSIAITGAEGRTDKTGTTEVTLTLSATDTGSGMGAGAQMQFSNDGATWSSFESYAQSKAEWTLLDTAPGTEQPRTVYVKFKDVAGNWSNAISDSIILDKQAPSAPLW